MKKFIRIISMLLAAMMILGMLSSMMTVSVFAEDSDDSDTETETETETTTEADELETEGEETEAEAPTKEPFDHVATYFASPEEKIASMELAYKNGDEYLYVDSTSGEVAYVNTKTGEKLFTNPYDVASSTGNEATKYEILSQIIVSFSDKNGQEQVFTSYEQAAERDQITVEKIKGGIRVEYTIGREQSRILVPRLISMERFEEMILQPLLEMFGEELYNPRSTNTEVFEIQKALSYYMIYSVDKLDLSNKERENMDNTFGGLYDDLRKSDAQYARALKQFPIIETMPVYVFDPDASESELTRAESVIMKYCPDYSFEELEYDHILTEYTSDSANPPVFRMALEYKVEEDGLAVRLPANGIRFNESLYTLDNIVVLPYMGAGNSAYEGYNFFPDGSGTLFDFQNLNTNQTRAVSSKVYGTDFAYHEITGTYQKTIRYPVFGIVEESVFYTYETYDSEGNKIGEDNVVAGNIVEAIRADNAKTPVNYCNGQVEGLRTKYNSIINASSSTETRSVKKRGFVCIIEEGDALASLTTYHAGALSDYNTIKMQFVPRPKDSYKVEGSVSVGTGSEWTVISDRKYVGNYKMKYITLSDAEANAEDAQDDAETVKTYDASWFGMAVAYRDYLTNKGIISKLTDDELTSDIPLYIETFGTIETTEKILSIPVTVMAPLTTFDNIETMYDELAAQGMKNINFKLTGYANGGMYATMPGNLKFEKAVGGNEGFQELLDKANSVNNSDEDSNFGVFPDFDFAYAVSSGLFDGYSPLKHNAKTIDNRYASQRSYSATRQTYENFYNMVISPAYFVDFYEKLQKNYAEKYEGVLGISVSTLGSALNSDFDEDEPYNREDSKQFTVDAFEYLEQNYGQVMTDNGNAYTWKYVDHILNVEIDSSRYNFASEAVPFIGVVLHGSIQFAGAPLNMEGDLKYAMLKAIENGASPYFILSYQNTNILKEDSVLSKYYSIRYDIWSDDIIDTYSAMNSVLADVQNKYIVDHQFLSGAERIPDADELANDILLEYKELLEQHENSAMLLEKELERAASIARENGKLAEEYAEEAFAKIMSYYEGQIKKIEITALHDSEYYKNLEQAYLNYKNASALKDSTDPAEQDQYKLISDLYYVIKHHNTEKVAENSTYTVEYQAYKAFIAGLPAGYEAYVDNKTAVEQAYKDYAAGGESIVVSDDDVQKADIYNKYLAAESAIAYVKACMDMTFSEAYELYYKKYSNDKYKSFSDSNFIKNCSEDDANAYYNYCKIESEIQVLSNNIKEIDSAFSQKSFENYIGALVEYNWMLANPDKTTETELAYLKAMVDQSRDSAIDKISAMGLLLTDGIEQIIGTDKFEAILATTGAEKDNAIAATVLKEMKNIYDTAKEYVALSEAAIYVLAAAEDYELKYIEGEEENYLNIYMDDPDMPSVVKESIERAQATYYYIEEDGYEKIVDGYETAYTTADGQRIYRSAKNSNLYYYGTYEEGYQYLQMVRSSSGITFEVYNDNLTSQSTTDKNGNIIYANSEGEFGKNVYFTIADGKMTYYEQIASGIFVEKAATVYNGTLVAVRSGVEIYQDGDVYYSVNSDGTYTRYEYNKSVKACYDEIVEHNDRVIGAVASIQNDPNTGDLNILDTLLNRLEISERISNRYDQNEEAEEEESKYATENVVCVVFGNDDGSAYKAVILNYNNYAVKVEYDGIVYTIQAHYFAVHDEKGGSK